MASVDFYKRLPALTSFDDDVSDSGSQHTVGAQVAADLPVGALANVGVCPVASVQATFFDGGNDIAVPLGVALGAGVEVDSGIAVVPFAVPQFIWSRRSIDGVDDAFTDSSFGIRGGANLVVSNLFFGALINRSFEDTAETVFGVQGGIVF